MSKIILIMFLSLCFTIGNKSMAQNAVIDSAQREQERQRWNNSLLHDTAYHYNKQPNAFLAEAIKGRKPGKAVDVAMGQGRNAIFLAKMGWDVTGYDIADEAIAFAKAEAKRQNVSIHTVLQGSEEFDFGTEQWDLISFIYSGCMEDVPGMAQRMKKGLKKGGLIVFEFFHRDAGVEMNRFDFGCPANLEKDILLKICGFKILRYEEKMGISDYGLDSNKLVYMIAEKE
jgi:SAM-dependent methyltransferase